ncbi:MAG: hypothetical protein K2Q25_14780 [Mycobacteriaceae bacterium]|nr:hypothetical protein [Mycobacteriaceae bacterium]
MITRAVIAIVCTALALGIAVWLADPAQALGPPPDGRYTYTQAGAPSATWTLTALCDQVNGSRYYEDYANPLIQANFCVVNVVSETANPGAQADRGQNFSGRAQLVGQHWAFEVGQPDGTRCPDGSTASSTETYSFDEETLAGTHTSLHGAVCGMQPSMSKTSFTLTLAGPPPSPIQRYPLQCNNLAMCY